MWVDAQICLLLALVAIGAGQQMSSLLQRCYGEDLGCYPVVIPPFRPRSLRQINAKFRLYTTSSEEYELITKDNVLSTKFNSSLRTVVIAHGFTRDPDEDYVFGTAVEIIQKKNVNVILVDGDDGLSLGFAAFSNALVIGGLLEQLIRATRDLAGAQYSNFHLVGQSMGCNVVASAGKRAKENGELIGRITGLDPAGPFYEEFGPSVSLGASDAAFVDCIRTDKLGWGFEGRCGTVDYYVNGGIDQPGCSTLEDYFLCSHQRAFYFFKESVNSDCNFVGYPCQSAKLFNDGQCSDCGPGGCAVMGYKSEGQIDKNGTFYLTTNSRSPYCISQ